MYLIVGIIELLLCTLVELQQHEPPEPIHTGDFKASSSEVGMFNIRII